MSWSFRNFFFKINLYIYLFSVLGDTKKRNACYRCPYFCWNELNTRKKICSDLPLFFFIHSQSFLSRGEYRQEKHTFDSPNRMFIQDLHRIYASDSTHTESRCAQEFNSVEAGMRAGGSIFDLHSHRLAKSQEYEK